MNTEQQTSEEAAARRFWLEISDDKDIIRVVCDGHHYTAHEPGKGGFGSQVFKVEWHNVSKAPIICSLIHQGKVPSWIKYRLPDNARMTSLGYAGKAESAFPDDIEDEDPAF